MHAEQNYTSIQFTVIPDSGPDKKKFITEYSSLIHIISEGGREGRIQWGIFEVVNLIYVSFFEGGVGSLPPPPFDHVYPEATPSLYTPLYNINICADFVEGKKWK